VQSAPIIASNPPSNTFTDEEAASLEAIFGDICRVPDARGRYELAVCAAQQLQWRTFTANAHDDKPATKAAAQLQLVKQCIVGVAWLGQKALASSDDSAGMKAPRDMLDQMLRTRGFAGVADGGPMSRAIMRLNNDAIDHAEK
jgi:hypothetical protein